MIAEEWQRSVASLSNSGRRSSNHFAAVSSKNLSVRKPRLISAVLVVILAVSASGCAMGWSIPRQACSTRKSLICLRTQPTAVKTSPCGHVLGSQPRHCSLRSLTQFQFAQIRNFEVAAIPLPTTGKVLPPRQSPIHLSSVGSPETDRGPPRS